MWRGKKWERGVIAERIERVGLHLMAAQTGVIATHTQKEKKKEKKEYFFI